MTVEHLQHANIRFKFGWLDYITALPEVHRFHRGKDPRHFNKNSAGGSVIWDQIFGTYHYDPEHPPKEFGIADKIPSDYFGQQAMPFVWIARDSARKLPFERARRWAAVRQDDGTKAVG